MDLITSSEYQIIAPRSAAPAFSPVEVRLLKEKQRDDVRYEVKRQPDSLTACSYYSVAVTTVVVDIAPFNLYRRSAGVLRIASLCRTA